MPRIPLPPAQQVPGVCPHLAPTTIRPMSTSYQNLTLCVPRRSALPYPFTVGGDDPSKHLSHPVAVSSTIEVIDSRGKMLPNHVLLKVDRFGFSANNVTYGMLGEDPHFLYFEFHKAPKTATTSPSTHGTIPVWGFATVTLSSHPEIKVGERVFGYLGMSRYLLLPVEERVNKYNFFVPRSHLPKDRRPYNQMTRCGADPLYSSIKEDEIMIYRPLFWTSFWCEDWLHSTGITKSATDILISSASAKTAYCLAFVLGLRRLNGQVALPSGTAWSRGREESVGKPRIVGLTSKKNLKFTKSLEIYDEVLTYDEVNRLGGNASATWVYVDVTGNGSLNKKVSATLNSRIIKGVSLGMSDPSGKISNPNDKGTPLEMFFMVEWLSARRARLSTKEIANMQWGAWDALMRSCHAWITIERIWWLSAKSWMDETKGVVEAYEECVGGEIGPDKGLVMSMWEQGAGEHVSSKL